MIHIYGVNAGKKNKLPGTLGKGLACDSKVVFNKALRRLSRSLSKLGQDRAVKNHDQYKETNPVSNKTGAKGATETIGLSTRTTGFSRYFAI